MHYANGRAAKNGDKVVCFPSYGGPVTGILYDAVVGQDYCNGKIAPTSPTDPGANLKECLHFDDVRVAAAACYPKAFPDSAKVDVAAAGVKAVGVAAERFDLGGALNALRKDYRVTREGWNGKGQYLQLQHRDEGSKMTQPYVFIRSAQGDLVPWVCSQSDLLATDWRICGPNGD
jgi:hypothetical protein